MSLISLTIEDHMQYVISCICRTCRLIKSHRCPRKNEDIESIALSSSADRSADLRFRFLEPLGGALDGLVLDISETLSRAEERSRGTRGGPEFRSGGLKMLFMGFGGLLGGWAASWDGFGRQVWGERGSWREIAIAFLKRLCLDDT